VGRVPYRCGAFQHGAFPFGAEPLEVEPPARIGSHHAHDRPGEGDGNGEGQEGFPYGLGRYQGLPALQGSACRLA